VTEREQSLIEQVEAIRERLRLSYADVACFAHISLCALDDFRLSRRATVGKTVRQLERFVEMNEDAQTRAKLRCVE